MLEACKLCQNRKRSIFLFQLGGPCRGEFYSLQRKVEVKPQATE